MGDFINTIDLLGDEAVIDSLIERTITEYKDNVITSIGSMAFAGCNNLKVVELPNVNDVNTNAFYMACPGVVLSLPSLATLKGQAFAYAYLKGLRLPNLQSIPRYGFYYMGDLVMVVLENTETVCPLEHEEGFYSTQIDGQGSHAAQKNQGYVYVPNALVDAYKNATNWTTLAHKIRAIEDYTLSGTLKGAIILGDETEIVDDEATSVGASRFLNNTVLISVDLPKATSVGANAFEGCTVLEEVNMPLLKTMGNYVWRSCKKLKNISLPLVPEIGREAFNGCVELTSADFQNVTSVGASAFQGCTLLKTANMPLLKQIGASAFVNCASLEAIDFPLATALGTSAGGPFAGCTSLKSVNLPIVTAPFKSTFGSCTSLEEISLPAATRLHNQVFQNCSALKSVDLPEVTQLDNGVFAGCSSLEKLDLPKATSLGVGTFNTMTNFKALILRSTTLCTIGSSNDNFLKTPIADGTGYIYVPRALVEEYKVATNWTVFANQFRALEDYTVDGTITGALDESKI